MTSSMPAEPVSSSTSASASEDNEQHNVANENIPNHLTANGIVHLNDVSAIKQICLHSLINNNNNVACFSGEPNRQTTDAPAIEPPTPPRTPVNAAAITTMSNVTGAQMPATSFNHLPTLSVTPVAKLMANSINNNHQNMFNNNSKATDGANSSLHCGDVLGKKSHSTNDDSNRNSDDGNDGGRECDLDDDDAERMSNSIGNSPKRKRKSNYQFDDNGSKRRSSDATRATPISDFDEDDVDDNDGEDDDMIGRVGNCDGVGQRSSSDSGDENLSDMGSSSSKLTNSMRQKSSNSFENFGINDASFDSISASVLMQQQKGDALSAAKATQEYFDKASLVRIDFICLFDH